MENSQRNRSHFIIFVNGVGTGRGGCGVSKLRRPKLFSIDVFPNSFTQSEKINFNFEDEINVVFQIKQIIL